MPHCMSQKSDFPRRFAPTSPTETKHTFKLIKALPAEAANLAIIKREEIFSQENVFFWLKHNAEKP